jgi:hypothetical protein
MAARVCFNRLTFTLLRTAHGLTRRGSRAGSRWLHCPLYVHSL